MKLADSIDKYKVYELQGKGGFAEVYRAVELETGTEVAVKKISKQSVTERKLWDRVKQELAIHNVLEHPSIVKVHTCFQDTAYIYLVLEFCPNGELRKLLEERNAPFNENQARGVLKQVLLGLKYLHSHRIIHRDITLSNLLLTREWNVKIADFGLAVKIVEPDEKHKTMCGTPNYIAPEIVKRNNQGPEIDIWNVGIMLYTLLVGKPPFDTEYGGVKATLQKVITEEIAWPSHLSPEVVNLIDLMLKKNPVQRISVQGIFNHPFMIHSKYEDLRMLTPATISQHDDSGFMTTSSTWLTNGGSSNSSNAISKFPSKCVGSRVPGCGSPFPSKSHKMSCCTSFSSNHSHPLRPQRQSSILNQPSIACSHASNLCLQCSHVENCACCLLSCLSFTGCNYHGNSEHQSISTSCANRRAIAVDTNEEEFPKVSSTSLLKNDSEDYIVRVLPPDLPVPPLSTTRLRPRFRVKGKAVYFSIISTGEVCLEFFKEKQGVKKLVEVMLISSAGMMISLQNPYEESMTTPGGGITFATYSYEELPVRFLKKYLYASKCVENERAVTSKIIYYSNLGKCHLMENGPDPNFTIHFYSGEKIVKKGSEVEILNKQFDVISKHSMQFSGDGLQPNLKALWDHFKTCWEECIIKERDLEELSSKRPGVTWFPNTSGHKPYELKEALTSENSDKENLPVNHFPVVSRRASASATSSLVGRPPSSQSSSRNKVIKKAFVPGIGTAFQMANGLVSVHYVDSTKLDVLPSSSKKTTIFTFTDVNSRLERYRVDADAQECNIPSEIREKISLYGAMVEKLMES